MAWVSLLFIVILATASKVTSLHCSDQQLPASGDDDLQQVTTLQYCLVDDCTIMMIETGEKLDIVYTTDSLIVTIPTDGHTSMVIAKLEDEQPCYTEVVDDNVPQSIATTMLIMIVSGYIVTVHLLFKELRSTMGKLLMMYSSSIVLVCVVIIVILLTHYRIKVNSLAICQIITTTAVITVVLIDSFATCILTHYAYVMYRCYNLQPKLSAKRSKFLFRCYISYAIGSVVLLVTITMIYYAITGNNKYLLQADGHCNGFNRTSYIGEVYTVLSKSCQIVMFVAYLFYYYKLSNRFRTTAITNRDYSKKLSVIAIVMGATIDIS